MDFALTIARQRAHFRTGATRPLAARLDALRRLETAITAHESLLLDALRRDLGKSPLEAYTSEIGFVLAEIRHARRRLPSWVRPGRRRVPWLVWPARATVEPEPYGVALIIGPWNYPFQLVVSPLVGALAAGNCAVLKPSEFAPQTAAALATLIADTFPPEYLTVVEGDREAGAALLREKFDTILFTGSTAVGRAVMMAAARHLTPVTLELGGKCPVIVAADAPVEVTARRIAWGKFLNAGQTCVAPDFVLVDRRIRDALVDALRAAIRGFYGDDPRHSPDYGRIVNRAHVDRLARHVPDATQDADDRYVRPTVLTDVSWNDPVMEEEIFGPLLPVLAFDDLDEPLVRLRDRPTPLALYLFTHQRDLQARVLAAVRSGGVCINDTAVQITGLDLPLGGLGESGFGRYRGRASFDCFSHHRTVVRRSTAIDPWFRYPPSRTSLATVKRVYRFLLGA